jgi:hypothetical protein
MDAASWRASRIVVAARLHAQRHLQAGQLGQALDLAAIRRHGRKARRLP